MWVAGRKIPVQEIDAVQEIENSYHVLNTAMMTSVDGMAYPPR